MQFQKRGITSFSLFYRTFEPATSKPYLAMRFRRILLFHILSLLIVSVHGKNFDIQSLLPVRGKAVQNIEYKATTQGTLALDIYQPDSSLEAKPSPVVIFIHGGSWIAGDKKEITQGFQSECLKKLLEAGCSVVSINYRLVNNSRTVTYPSPLADCKDAVKWVKRFASQYRFDPNRIAVMGTSAGGHLALMTAYAPDSMATGDAQLAQWSSEVKCVIDIYGPTHLGKILKAGLSRPVLGIISPFFPKKTLKMRDALLWSFTGKNANHPNQRHKKCLLYSPYTYVSSAVPTIVFHGDKDKTVPFPHTTLLKKKMKKAGKYIEVHTLKGEDHCFPTISTEETQLMCSQMIAFLNKYLLQSSAHSFSCH